MKRLLMAIILVGFINNLVSSQEEIVKKIRQSYNDYNKIVTDSKNEELEFYPAHFETRIVQNRPALGPVNVSSVYYFDEISNAEKAEDYDKIVSQVILRKVEGSESMPSFTDYSEYFFNEKGNLLFFYSKLTGYTCGEKRLYFDKGKLIKIVFNPLAGENCSEESDFPDFTRYSGEFTKDDLQWEKYVLKRSENYKKVLQSLFEVTN